MKCVAVLSVIFCLFTTGCRTVPTVFNGVTVDDGINGATVGDAALTKINGSADALTATAGRMPISRFVFDQGVPASDYVTAVNNARGHSYIMGELVDSSDVSTTTTTAYHDRVADYLSTIGTNVDLWEIGNEVNGEWLGTTSTVVTKIADAYDQVHAANQPAALTLYYNPNCWSDPTHEMFTWAGNNLPARMKSGLDYVLISYYEQDCNNYRPTPTTVNSVFDQLHTMFPNAKLGFGEVGLGNDALVNSANLTAAQSILNYYYGLRPTTPGYVGGGFWWHYYEDMFPYTTRPMWQTLNDNVR